jgi:hypothetical protein
MPYLREHHRRLALIAGDTLPQDSAELNFLICDMIDSFIARKGENYANLAEADAALGLAQHEFRRRIVATYEDKKLAENGEVFRGVMARRPLTYQQLIEACDKRPAANKQGTSWRSNAVYGQ